MKTIKLLVSLAFLFVYGNANALPRPPRPMPPRSIQRSVEQKVEQKAEENANKAIDKSLEKAEEDRTKAEAEAEKGLNKAAEKLEEAQKAQEEADAKVANIPDEIPEVSNTPYTPSESEFVFFPMKKGAVQVFATKDAKGKIIGQTRNTIKEITGSKNAFAIVYESESLDAKGNPTNKDNPLIFTYRIVIKDGIMYLDMKEMFGAIEGLNGVQASGTTMKIPSNLTVGQTLDDAAVKVKIGFINCSAVTTERTCLAIEDITVEAGTFNCYKVSQKTNATAMGIKSEVTTLIWYAKGAGAVKSETYDKKGKLQSTQELISNQ
jgi:hypothetical protein